MLKGFREFVFRGNVIDLAVAVVVGAAVAALVAAFSDALIKPVIGIFLGGGLDAGTWEINGQVIDFTLMINALITFLITVAVVYVMFVAPMNRLRQRFAKEAADAPAPADVVLLTEIRDLLRERNLQ